MIFCYDIFNKINFETLLCIRTDREWSVLQLGVFSCLYHFQILFPPFEIFKNYVKTFKDLTLRRPLHRKLRMRWFFDVYKVKESSFSKSDLTDPASDF